VITVTNSNAEFTQVGQLYAGTVDVEYVCISKYDCLEFNRTRRLTPNDTISVLARVDNPNQREGHV
jgi:adenosylcobinamide amidohydrolase